MNAERLAKANLELRVIGLGSCGSVFEIPGSTLALKKSSNVTALWNDFGLTNTVYNSLLDTQAVLQQVFPDRTIPRTPKCHEFFLQSSASWWEANLDRFPQEHRTPAAVFSVDRILPLPEVTRNAMIDMYFSEEDGVQEEARNSLENKHCLVRLYLGENETDEEQSGSYDSLLNFPLKLNMMEDLELAVEDLAVEMAIGLAVIHWQARIDGMDTEFVLGSSAERPRERFKGVTTRGRPPQEIHDADFKSRSTHLWLLDFDKASEISFTKEDVDKKLVPAFLGNDPYFPRPDVDMDLWTAFSGAYLTASSTVLKAQKVKQPILKLPQRFLEKVVEMIESMKGWNPEEDITFGD